MVLNILPLSFQWGLFFFEAFKLRDNARQHTRQPGATLNARQLGQHQATRATPGNIETTTGNQGPQPKATRQAT